jgi:hypothetical protein
LPNCFPKRYHKLIAEQTAIGWRHLFNGHLSLEWRAKQDYYIRRRKISTLTHSGLGWSTRTLSLLWTDFFTVWTARNEAIHGHDSSTHQQARCKKLAVEMELLHTYRDDVLASDKDAFIGDQADLQKYLDVATASQVQNWIYVWKPLILSSLNEAKASSIRGVNHLTTYFASRNQLSTRRSINNRSHRKARPRLRNPPILPQPGFRFRSLRSFFAPTHPPTSPL